MMQVHNALGYAYNALAFLFDAELQKKISTIYLFGSAVRQELEEGSDIDLFIDCLPPDENFVQKRAEVNLGKFYKSKDYEKWKRLGTTNAISITAGELRTWALKKSVLSEGLLLYKNTAIEKGDFDRKVLVIFDVPKAKPKYLRFTREFFGRKEYAQHGRIGELGGERVSANVIIIAQSSLPTVQKFLQKHKVNYRMMQFLAYKE